ncbi:uncharacterized protein LOC132707074 [Cylas formicarius]|uniref:uncharacterized protein LOC132707074 n=1 Tax=Cylas formicarius TaxID=197179 RepID=UPI00295849B0|nr:uncharacterized protein LOC132707074 [Cylas formicarius]
MKDAYVITRPENETSMRVRLAARNGFRRSTLASCASAVTASNMASGELSLEQIQAFFKENGGKVKNRDAVRYFRRYLTDPENKDENRVKFKQLVNTLAHTKTEDNEKVLILKSKYLSFTESPPHSPSGGAWDPRNALGIPTFPLAECSPQNTPVRQPPPYRNPPPVASPSPSLSSVSLSSSTTTLSEPPQNEPPQAPPRRRDSEKRRSKESLSDAAQREVDAGSEDKASISVKERTQKFNRMASTEDELSPRVSKSAEKEKVKPSWMVDDADNSTLPPLEPKKCQEWYVTASRGDCQELMKLARSEPRLVHKKDPFSVSRHV